MNVNSALNAANSANALKQAVGVAMLSKIKDTQVANMQTMLQDFHQAQASAKVEHPNLGKRLDIRI